MKKKILGTSDDWSMRKSSHRPSKAAYYIEDCWISCLLFSFGTFNSILAGLGRYRVYLACCSDQIAYKPVQQSRQYVEIVYFANTVYCDAAVSN